MIITSEIDVLALRNVDGCHLRKDNNSLFEEVRGDYELSEAYHSAKEVSVSCNFKE